MITLWEPYEEFVSESKVLKKIRNYCDYSLKRFTLLREIGRNYK